MEPSNGIENKIMDLMTREYSWEQIIYDLIAAEGLDPWNLDIQLLSSSFLKYMKKMETLDFRVPAKYIIISAVLLRMKSDFLSFFEPEEAEIFEDSIEEIPNDTMAQTLDISNFSIPSKRMPKRRVVVTDLIDSLKKVLDAKQRKVIRTGKKVLKLEMGSETVTQKINNLYEKINSLLGRIKEEEVKFSDVVPKWDRENIIDTFMPLIHLDHEEKVECKQDEFFQEIFIKKLNGKANGIKAPKSGKRLRNN